MSPCCTRRGDLYEGERPSFRWVLLTRILLAPAVAWGTRFPVRPPTLPRHRRTLLLIPALELQVTTEKVRVPLFSYQSVGGVPKLHLALAPSLVA